MTGFFGVGHKTASRILARLQIHHHCKVSELTEPQVTALTSYLSSPVSSARPSPTPLAIPAIPPAAITLQPVQLPKVPTLPKAPKQDRLDTLKIETDLKKSMLADIFRLRQIGTYRGRRWVFHYRFLIMSMGVAYTFAPFQTRRRSSCSWSEYTCRRSHSEKTQSCRADLPMSAYHKLLRKPFIVVSTAHCASSSIMHCIASDNSYSYKIF